MSDILDLLNAAGLLKDAAGNRAPPRPLVSGRLVLGLLAVIGASGIAFWSYSGDLARISTGLRFALGVTWCVGAAITAFLAGNQLDAALTRRRIATKDA